MNSLRACLLLAASLVLCCTACVVAVHSPPAHVRHAPAPPPPRPVVHADVGLFYDDLAPYGVWREVAPYGWTWSPYSVRAGWRPYSEGHWVYSDYGWTWVSDWDWGWAPFHYGRWTLDARHGWIWIPGTQWAPAWVAWRHGGGWVGWAPLPPQARWRAGVGLDWHGVDIDVVIRPAHWCFVEDRRLVGPGLASRIAFASRNDGLARRTRHDTRYAMVDNHVVNRGVDFERIQGVSQSRIPRYRVVDEESRGKGARYRVEGQNLRVFRPRIDDAPPRRTPVTGTARRQATPRDTEGRTDESNRSHTQHRGEEASEPGSPRRAVEPPAREPRRPFRPAPDAGTNPGPRRDDSTPASAPRARSKPKDEAETEAEAKKPAEKSKQSVHKARWRGKRPAKKDEKDKKESEDEDE